MHQKKESIMEQRKVKIQLITYTDEDYSEHHAVLADGKRIWMARDLAQDCPEDATLSRGMTSGDDILTILSQYENTKFDFLSRIECKTEEEWENLVFNS